jgi:glutamyl-Q tRNA(Asp) synthetase
LERSDLKRSEYIGRFAPSPTGPLHFGSLVTALASYLHARSHNGKWLVRIEDIDGPRTVPGAAEDILETLDFYGMKWDGPVLYQSTRTEAYEAALEELKRRDLVYPVYNSLGKPAWKARMGEGPEEGFTLRRSDGPFAYQLAVVVDDAAQGITDVVRGEDLLDSTPRQNWLQRQLGYPQPRYLHIPVVTNAAGEKLSKQTGAPALRREDKERNLEEARKFLDRRVGQPILAAAAFPGGLLLDDDRALVHPHPAGETQLPGPARGQID